MELDSSLYGPKQPVNISTGHADSWVPGSPQKDTPRDEKRSPGLSYFTAESHLALHSAVLSEFDVLLCFKTKLQYVVGRVRALLYHTSPRNL